MKPVLKEIRVELTTTCHQECGYCYVRHLRSPGRRTVDSGVLTRRLGEAVQLGLETVSFTGGEPLCEPQALLRHMDQARSLGLEVGLLTSGHGLTPELADELVASGLTWARISVDTHPDDNEAQRELRRSFHHVPEAIDLFRERGIPVVLRPTATPYNGERLKRLAEFAAEKGVDRIEIQPYMPCNIPDVDKYYLMSPSQHFRTLETVLALRAERKCTPEVRIYSGWFEFLSRHYDGAPVRRSRCGRSFLFLDVEGRLKTCAMSQHFLTHNDGGARSLADVWYEDEYLRDLRDMKPTGICMDCDWFRVCNETWCPAVNTVAHLPVNAPNPVCPKVMMAGSLSRDASTQKEAEGNEKADYDAEMVRDSAGSHSARRMRRLRAEAATIP